MSVEEIMAGTVADAIRERLIRLPVVDASSALWLAYTVRMQRALANFVDRSGLDPAAYADVDLGIDAARRAAAERGMNVPTLPWLDS